MSTSLRWQDVAGQVRGPDYTDSAQMITRGIEGLGKSVQDVISAPEQQRRAQLAREMMVLDVESKGLQAQADLGMQMGKDLEVRNDKKSAKEFGAAQSVLEAGARKAALEGKSFDEFMKSDAYLSLSEGARTYGASHLSDAFLRGDEQRITMAERAADNARQERQWAAGHALQQQSAARQNREFDLRERQLRAAENQGLIAQGILSKDPETNRAIAERRSAVAGQLAPLFRGRELYEKLSPAEAVKKSEIFGNWTYNPVRRAQELVTDIQGRTGKKIDPWMLNQMLVEGGGADTLNGGFNAKAAEEYLMDLVQLQEAATYNQKFLQRMEENALNGKTYKSETLEDEAFKILTGVDAPAAPAKKSAKPQPWAPSLSGAFSKPITR